ncbi:MAG: tetratricopeptide repeat protein [Bacteroidota bacterium]
MLKKQTKAINFLLILLTGFQQAYGQLDRETEKNIDKAVEYFNNEEYEKALTYANKLIEKESSDYVSWALKGRALFTLGYQEDGIKAMSKAIEINPGYYQAYGYRAVMYNLTGSQDIKQVISDVNMALAHDPDNFELIEIKAGILYKTGQFGKAFSEYDKLLKSGQGSYSVIVFHSSVNRKLGNPDLALQGYNKAIQIDPDQSFAYEERAFLFVEQEKYDQAIKDYGKVLLTIPDNKEFEPVRAYTYNNRGLAYHKAGNNQQALTEINHSLELLPTNSYAYKNRALVYIDMAIKENACADLEKAIELGYTQQYGNEVEKLMDQHCK